MIDKLRINFFNLQLTATLRNPLKYLIQKYLIQNTKVVDISVFYGENFKMIKKFYTRIKVCAMEQFLSYTKIFMTASNLISA